MCKQQRAAANIKFKSFPSGAVVATPSDSYQFFRTVFQVKFKLDSGLGDCSIRLTTKALVRVPPPASLTPSAPQPMVESRSLSPPFRQVWPRTKAFQTTGRLAWLQKHGLEKQAFGWIIKLYRRGNGGRKRDENRHHCLGDTARDRIGFFSLRVQGTTGNFCSKWSIRTSHRTYRSTRTNSNVRNGDAETRLDKGEVQSLLIALRMHVEQIL